MSKKIPKNEWNLSLRVISLTRHIEAYYMVMGDSFADMMQAGLLAAESFLVAGNQVGLLEVYHYCEHCRDYHDVTDDAGEEVGRAFDRLFADLRQRLEELGIPSADTAPSGAN